MTRDHLKEYIFKVLKEPVHSVRVVPGGKGAIYSLVVRTAKSKFVIPVMRGWTEEKTLRVYATGK